MIITCHNILIYENTRYFAVFLEIAGCLWMFSELRSPN